MEEPRDWGSNFGGEVRDHRRGPHLVPQEIVSETTCKRLPGKDLPTGERKKQEDHIKKFARDAVAQGALAGPSGRQKAGMVFQSCHELRLDALHGPLIRRGQSHRTEGHDLGQGCPVGQGQCQGRDSSVSWQQATPHPMLGE